MGSSDEVILPLVVAGDGHGEECYVVLHRVLLPVLSFSRVMMVVLMVLVLCAPPENSLHDLQHTLGYIYG